MRALKVLVVVMGVLIVLGTVALAVAIVMRLSGGGGGRAGFDAALAEPAGTRIAGASEAAGRLTVWLQGGGPDRVVVIDERDGKPVGRLRITQ